MRGGPPLWCQRFMGVPFSGKGWDFEGASCWGFVTLLFREAKGIELPRYEDHPCIMEREEISALYRQEAARWTDILTLDDSRPRPFDIINFKYMGHGHAGVIVEPPWMLHCGVHADPSQPARYDSFTWKHRIQQILRHPDLI